jgi:outer membrane protein
MSWPVSVLVYLPAIFVAGARTDTFLFRGWHEDSHALPRTSIHALPFIPSHQGLGGFPLIAALTNSSDQKGTRNQTAGNSFILSISPRLTGHRFHSIITLKDERPMKSFVRRLLPFAFLGVLLPGLHALAQEEQSFPSSLTLARAVEVSLLYHPSLRAADANVQSSSASVMLARAAFFPVLNMTGSATRTEGAFVFNPAIPPRIQAYDNYTAALNVQQMLYDFGKTSGRFSGNQALLQASSYDREGTRENVIANVEIAYYGVVQAQRVVQVNTETLAQAEAHLLEARSGFSIGTRPQFDVTKSLVDVANANVNLIAARNGLRIARLQLENAMGVHATTPFELADSLGIPPFSMSLDSAKSVTLASRQDLLSARAHVRSDESFVTAAVGGHLPTLSLNGTWNWSGFNFPLQSRWNAGLTVSVPVFQGLAVAAQVDQAQANLQSSQASLDLVRENAMLDVEQNYLSLREASDRIDATAQLIEQANQSLKLAEQRYKAGVGSAIEITDAQITLANARLSNIGALYDYNTSLIRLQRAMGVLGE